MPGMQEAGSRPGSLGGRPVPPDLREAIRYGSSSLFGESVTLDG